MCCFDFLFVFVFFVCLVFCLLLLLLLLFLSCFCFCFVFVVVFGCCFFYWGWGVTHTPTCFGLEIPGFLSFSYSSKKCLECLVLVFSQILPEDLVSF